MSWFFEQFGRMGGAGGGAYRNPLAAVGIPATELFVREVIQNSVDRAESGKPVRILFREERLEGDDMSRVSDTLDLGLSSPLVNREGLLPSRGTEAPLLPESLSVLYVEDFETQGLGGTDRDVAASMDDNYRRLCLESGVTSEGLGGTFGYGKATYWAVSDIWTVVFYSRFKPSDRTDSCYSRLIGVSWFKEHTHKPEGESNELRYTGRAWFGRVSEAEDHCLPFVDVDADTMAEKLGFSPRQEGDHGTSAMILAHKTEPSEIRDAVERYWWPRIIEDRLEIVLPDGTPPEPRRNPRLRPFIRGWDLISGQENMGENDLVVPLNYKREPLGQIALTTVEESSQESRRSLIALVRGPGMVVEEYEGPSSAISQPNTVGVFKADPQMDRTLAASEPPAHNTWDHATTREDRDLTAGDRKSIKELIRKIRNEVRKFLRAHQPPPPEAPDRCRRMEKLLGGIFATVRTSPQPPPESDADIFSVQFSEPLKREVPETGGEVRISANLSVKVIDEAFTDGEDSIVVRMTSWIDLLIDDGRSAGRSERLNMAFMKADDPKDQDAVMGEQRRQGTVTEVLMVPDEGSWEVELLSDPLPHPEYSAKLNFLVEKVS